MRPRQPPSAHRSGGGRRPRARGARTADPPPPPGVRRLLALLPGLALCGALTGAILGARPLLPAYLSEALLALAGGLVVGNLGGAPAATTPGLRWLSRTGLRLGIALMGARLAFGEILQGGGAALLLLLGTMTLAALGVIALARWLAVPRRLTTLLAVGTAVCGNSAIIATAPLLEADEREVAFAVWTITLFGTLAVFAFPFLGHALHLPEWHYGVWAGAAVQDTAQVLAAGLAFGESAAAVATVVKLTRNTLLAPILIGLSVRLARHRRTGDWRAAVRQGLPHFVVGFLAIALLNTFGVLPTSLRGTLLAGSRGLTLAALAAIGLSLRVADLRMTGWRPFLVGLGGSVGLAAAALLATSATREIWQDVFGSF